MGRACKVSCFDFAVALRMLMLKLLAMIGVTMTKVIQMLLMMTVALMMKDDNINVYL